MEVAVDRQQPVAHQADQVAEVRFAPAEVGRVRHRYVVVGLGPQHEDHVGVEQAQREDRPEALVGLQQQRQRVIGEAPGARQREAGFSGREWDGRRALLAQVAEHRGERVGVEERRRTNERHGRSLQQNWLAGQFCWERTSRDGPAEAWHNGDPARGAAETRLRICAGT